MNIRFSVCNRYSAFINSASNKVQSPAISSVPSKMDTCKHDTAASQKLNEMVIPMLQGVPSIAALLQDCNFINIT